MSSVSQFFRSGLRPTPTKSKPGAEPRPCDADARALGAAGRPRGAPDRRRPGRGRGFRRLRPGPKSLRRRLAAVLGRDRRSERRRKARPGHRQLQGLQRRHGAARRRLRRLRAAPGSAFDVGSTHPRSVAIGDLNGDGKPDLVTANPSTQRHGAARRRLRRLRRCPGQPLRRRHVPDSVAIGDLNHDGKPDLVTADSATTTSRCCSDDGYGSFAAPGSPFAAGPDPISVAIGDLNGDGKPDLVTANARSNNVTVLLGNGSGGFAPGSHLRRRQRPGLGRDRRSQRRRKARPGHRQLRLQRRHGAARRRLRRLRPWAAPSASARSRTRSRSAI